MIFLSILILIVAIALPSIHKNLSPTIISRISSIVLIYAGALSFNALYIQSIGSGIGIYSGLFQVSSVSQYIDTFIFLIGSLILVAWPSPNQREEIKNVDQFRAGEIGKDNYASEYSLIILFSTLGGSLLISSSDLISMYLSIELQSFGVYILSSIYRYSESATSAGLKYFLLGGLSSCLILLGSGIVYSYTGLTNFESIYSIVTSTDSTTISKGLSLGLIIIFIGFLFKIAAAPLHNWAPDVYDESPTIVTIWLTIMPKISIIFFLLEIFTHIGMIGKNLVILSLVEYLFANPGVLFREDMFYSENSIIVLKNLLLISSLLSLIIGTVVGLAQSRIKRLLAYSTISHIGFILLALSINTEQSIDSLIFYIIQYSITNLNTFLVIIALGYIIHSSINTKSEVIENKNNRLIKGSRGNLEKGSEKDIREISELKGQFFSNPLLSLSLTVCLFSMAGVPPLLGFFSKQFVLYSAIYSGYYFMSIVGIIVSVISASYYLKIIKVLHSEPENLINGTSGENKESFLTLNTKESLSNNNSIYLISSFHSYLISTLTLSILFFIFKPSILLNSTQLLSLTLFSY